MQHKVSGANTKVPEEEELMVINIDSSEQSRARLQLQPTPMPRAPPRPTPRLRALPRPTLGFALRLAQP